MGKYDDRSYHQLRRMCRNLPDEDKAEVSSRIVNYYKITVEKIVERQHPDYSEAERKAGVIERMYRDDFSVEDTERIKSCFIAYHQAQQAQPFLCLTKLLKKPAVY